jgi:phage terminase small subunit
LIYSIPAKDEQAGIVQPVTNKTIMYKINTKWHKKAKEGMEHIISSLEVDKLDHVTLDLLGDALSTMYHAIDGINQHGYVVMYKERLVVTPFVKIKNDAKVQAFNIMKQFGLNPLDRKKLNRDNIEDDELEFEKLL